MLVVGARAAPCNLHAIDMKNTAIRIENEDE